MKDQYGNTIPKDLVVLDVKPPTPTELKRIMATAWYEPESAYLILVSGAAIRWLSETDPLDCGVDVGKPLRRIAEALKRYSVEDGFYHA